MSQSVTAFSPASIGNVSVGFDVLGASLAPVDSTLLGDQVRVTASAEYALTVAGRFADRLPAGTDNNIVTDCYHFFNRALAERGIPVQTLAVHLEKNLPIGSGLGSSASSIVAAFYAFNAFYDQPFDDNTLLFMMGECEGQISGAVHYDNVAPALFGGMTLMTGLDKPICENVPVFEDWYWTICYSGISVSTSAARKILPTDIPMATTLQFGRQLACFIHASHTQNAELASAVLSDVIAEPYRQSLLPHFAESRAFAMQAGALGFGISGSGPTVFAACPDLATAEKVAAYLNEHYIQNDDGFTHVCRIDTAGSRVL
ncbi:MAG: homoserine kinase [Glaciecola sp.]|jgi:homoserine kinase